MTAKVNATALTKFAAIVAKAIETRGKTVKAVEELAKARVTVFEGFIALVKEAVNAKDFAEIQAARDTFELLPKNWQQKILSAKSADNKKLKSLISLSPDTGKIYVREKFYKSMTQQELLKWVDAIESPFKNSLAIAEIAEKAEKKEKTLLETAESKLSSLSKLLKWFEETSGKPISSMTEAEKVVNELKAEIENIKAIETQTSLTQSATPTKPKKATA